MTLPVNVQPGTIDPIPDGVFLVPLCTTREALIEMIYALDSAHVQSGKLIVIKDFLNALQYIQNPLDALCMADITPPTNPPEITIETQGLCKRVVIDGVAVTDWICESEDTGESWSIEGDCEEEMAGCGENIRNFKFIGGVLNIRTCDGWEPVEGQDAPAVTTTTAAAVAAGMSYQQWKDSGMPELPNLESVPHANPDYTTAAVLQCAKASAIVDTLKLFLGEIKDTLASLVDDNLSFSDVVELLAAGYIIGNLPGVFAVASLIFGAKETAESLTGQIDDMLTDPDLWSDIVCETTEHMNNSQVIGTDDVDEVITNWQERDLSGELLKQIVYAYPVSTWQKVTTKALPQTDCGCQQYLPYGYIPPLGGMTQFIKMVAGGGVGANTWQATGGTELDSINQTPMGTKLAQNAYETVYQGETYEGQSIFYCGFGVLIQKAVGVIIDSMKIDTGLVGTFSECKGRIEVFIPGTGWTGAGGSSTNFSTAVNDHVIFSGGTVVPSNATYFRIEAKGRGTSGAGEKVTWNNIRITGTRDGVGFIDTPLGE